MRYLWNISMRNKGSNSCKEDQTLIAYKYQNDINSYRSLLKHSLQTCDLCDKVFNNRYKILIHNAKHIIIPLLKQTLYQCPECLFQFISPKDLNLHTIQKHPNKVISPKYEPDMNVVKLEYNGIDNVEKPRDCHIPILPDKHPEILDNKPKLKQRIVFEDDLFDDDLMSDLAEDCQVNNNNFESPLLKPECIERNHSNLANIGLRQRIYYENSEFENHDINSTLTKDENDQTEIKHNEINSTELIKTAKPDKSNRIYKSVHYSKLINMGIFKCQWCSKIFTTRIELLKHEPLHMRLRQFRPMLCSVCERYIAGNYRNLNQHMATKHPDQDNKKVTLHKCQKCGLRYHNYYKHCVNYHIDTCNTCEKSTDSEKDKTLHQQEHLSMNIWDSKTVKMCDLCFSFMKNKQNCQYQWLGEVNEMGVRQECARCSNKFFEVNLVKMSNKLRDYSKEKGKKPLSNEARLKKLQLRLKNINKLNKF